MRHKSNKLQCVELKLPIVLGLRRIFGAGPMDKDFCTVAIRGNELALNTK
ncbi:hypothetical protein BY996DRAFT_6578268 [Phakopsora pachyrhizi]|uniref:Uncharacterized protein n=1 Tax=Phakopsora pachyrhizi TaxID=170000 RepID=A0AAV0BEM8_PHAPC|nr:hypothetical protein BY996DRAFT_6578268 [Phakopsora pachyrhizi]CAH7684861.1 hypothetical protein PPACK8108_LOCUS19296 [Phakopsora pachyrhizi]